jgi:eukaryotic-like serine/threonine-protein kinase
MADSPTEVVLGGRYCLGEVLGTGRSATVYEATDLLTGDQGTQRAPATAPRPLAAKVLHAHIAHDSAMRAAFIREARAGARVQRAGLVTILDVGEEDIADEPVVWIIMVQAPGIPLAEVVRSHILSVSTALVITSHVLDALTALHGAGLVHRDISPGNVMVELIDRGGSEQDCTVTVLDLGLAVPKELIDVGSFRDPSVRSEAGQAKLVTGTPGYMSPEQARGLTVDARGDLYAVGALLYLMLTGHAPFERSDPAAVLRAHVQAPVPAPSARADVPQPVDHIVSRAMAKSPSRRFASAAEMRATVEGALRAGLSQVSTTGTRVLPELDTSPARTVWVTVPGLEGVEKPTKTSVPPGAARSAAATSRAHAEAPRPPAHAPRPPAGTPASHLSLDAVLVLVCVLVLCGLVGLGWMATRQAPRARAVPRVLPTAVIGSPPASTGSPAPVQTRAANPSPSTPLPIVSAATEPKATPTLLSHLVVPSLDSLGIDQARTQLAAVGLILGDVIGQDSAKPQGTVLNLDPPAGRLVLRGSVVRLTVASGQNLVPPLLGLSRAQAIANVLSAGLVPVLAAAPDPQVPSGFVIGMNPDPATSVALGSVVTVLVSDGPAPSGPPTSAPPTGPPTQAEAPYPDQNWSWG